MIRAEIIANQSVQDDIQELLEQEIPDIEYTVFQEVKGKGLTSKKIGDTVWPEMNFILFAYVNHDSAVKIKQIMEETKQKFPREGMSYFFTKGEEV